MPPETEQKQKQEQEQEQKQKQEQEQSGERSSLFGFRSPLFALINYIR